MSDADRLETQVALSLFQLLPGMQPDNRTTLVYLIVGLILGRNVQLAPYFRTNRAHFYFLTRIERVSIRVS